MSLILNIDTALETAGICLSGNGEVLASAYNKEQKDHASWLHQAITGLLKESCYHFSDLQAVAVSIGPGSYTGLRVGLSAAKGFCYALNIPLITIGTLEIMANSVMEKSPRIICPLIDARRMEVYTAMYDNAGVEIFPPIAMILDENAFRETLKEGPVLFCGNGTRKLQPFLLQSKNALFSETGDMIRSLSGLAAGKFNLKAWSDLAYTEPLYIKEFYTTSERS